MSCHEIGHGMNSVVKEVIALYDAGEITLEPAKRIIAKARAGVWFCDGNEDEAVECISGDRCGYCLKETGPEERLYNLYEADAYMKDWRSGYDAVRETGGQLAHTCLCAKCFDELVPKIFGKDVSGEDERRKINEER